LKIQLGILTVPSEHAQDAADLLLQGGVRAIWNFTGTPLSLPERVVVRNEDLAASLALLTRKLRNSIEKYGL
jgi:redox-sensing transcriptional repressor